MSTYAEAVPADEHEAIYKAYWRGGFRSIAEAAKTTGHCAETIKRLVDLVPVALLEMPERMVPADRVRWCKVHGCCYVCGTATARKNAYTCRECAKHWKYCPTCKDVLPLASFYSPEQAYCKEHDKRRIAPGPTYRRRTRDEMRQELAAIQQMRADGKSWKDIGEHYGQRVKTIQQRCSDWRKVLGEIKQ